MGLCNLHLTVQLSNRWLNVMTNKNTIIETFSKMAPNYEETVNQELQKFWGWNYTSFVNTILELTPINQDDLILDIATGTASIPIKIAEGYKINKQILGLDITYPMLQQAKQKIKKSSGLIKLICGSALSIPLCSESLDLITCGLASHHLDMRQMLSEMKRVLKIGGTLTTADVCVPAFMRNPAIGLLLRGATFLYFFLTEDFNRASAEAGAISNVRTADEWLDLSKEVGFEDIIITKLNSKYSWLPGPLIMRAKKTVGEVK